MPDQIWPPYPKLEAKMPWKISEQGGKFCVVKKSDGKVVKCHPTERLAKLHITALYANEPSAAKKSVGYGMLKSLIEERVVELKACGANKPGGGGFAAGNTCARGGKGGFKEGDRVVVPKESYSVTGMGRNKTYGGGKGEVIDVQGLGFVLVKMDSGETKLVHETTIKKQKVKT